MSKQRESDFCFAWSSAPGETIADILEERNLSLMQFAQEIGRPPEQADELLRGNTPITSALAQKLNLVVGGSAAFWINREFNYREDLARLTAEEERKSIENWVKELPIKEMVSLGWLKPGEGGEPSTILRFFNVPDVRTWREKYQSRMEIAAFRTSPTFGSDVASVAAWLRQAEIESASISCKRWDHIPFGTYPDGNSSANARARSSRLHSEVTLWERLSKPADVTKSWATGMNSRPLKKCCWSEALLSWQTIHPRFSKPAFGV